MKKSTKNSALPPELASRRTDNVSKFPASSGKTKMLKYLSGRRLTRGEAIVAKCFECMNGYIDGRIDCEIYDCPLYPFMSYRNSKDK
jgi:hypothetical protein